MKCWFSRIAVLPVWITASVIFGLVGEFCPNHVCGLQPASAQLRSIHRSQSVPGGKAAWETHKTQLVFISASWDKILSKVAQDTGSTLVADRVPAGRKSFRDFTRYSRHEAVRILNNELEQHNYRLIEKNQFLVLIELSSARQEYRRPQIGPRDIGDTAAARDSTTIEPAARQPRRQTIGENVLPRNRDRNVRPAEYDRYGVPGNSHPDVAPPAPRKSVYGQLQPFRPKQENLTGSHAPIRRTGFQEYDETPAQEAAASPQPASPQPASPQPAAVSVLRYKPKTRDVVSLAKSIYNVFRDRTEFIEQGPAGLEAFRVFSPKNSAGLSQALFTIGVDRENRQLLIEGPAGQLRAVSRLLGLLDATPRTPNEATRLISTEKDTRQVARNLQPAVNRLIAANDSQAEPPAATPPDVAADPAADPGADSKPTAAMPDLVGGIRSDVSVEAMEELGVLIIKGNQADVDAVMAIINQIEELSARSAPDIHLRILEHVDGAALSQLLSTVYDQLADARGNTTREQPDISIIPVGSPNAVLILSSPTDLESVNALIDELDKPVKPHTSFKVFQLQHAIASQMETILEDFYTRQSTGGGAAALAERTGLMARIKIIADVRTNSVVILAQPNDLAEIAALIPSLDVPRSGPVSQVKVIELKHAVAEELAESLNSIIQATLLPPQQGTGQLGGFGGGGFGGGGTGSQELQEVRSTILEFLQSDGQRTQSGILSDIRINGDARSNTLIVTSPRESMTLILELVKKLDRPASATATIRHFRLRKADAQLTADLLNELFGDQTTGDTSVGVQLAGAEEASSVIPMRFSVDARTNSLIAVGTEESLEVVEALMYRLDAGDLRNHRTTLIKLKNIAAATVATTVSTFLQNQLDAVSQVGLSSAAEQIEQQVFFQSEDTTNTLLISATPQYFDQVREMVLTLDKEQPQVVIQAMIAEVTLEDVDEFGVDLGIQDPIFFQRSGSPGNFNFPGAGLPNTTAFEPGKVGGQGLSSLLIGRASGSTSFGGLGGLVLSASSEYLNVLIRALQAHRHVEILSRPQVRTLDNQEALLRLDTEQQRVSGFSQTVTGVISEFEVTTAGILLQVTPTISPDGNILMQLIAEKSSFRDGPMLPDGQGGVFTSLAKDVTRAETSIVVADQQTVVLGGLITRQDTTEIHKVPWIADVPWIGSAFRVETNEVVRKELLIFLTPRIIQNQADNELLKQIEAERMSYTEGNVEALHGPIYAVPPERQQNPDSGVFEMPAPGTWNPPLPMPAPNQVPGVPPEHGTGAVNTPASAGPPQASRRGSDPQFPARKQSTVVQWSRRRLFQPINLFHRRKPETEGHVSLVNR